MPVKKNYKVGESVAEWSDEVHEIIILHHAGHLGHAWLGHGAPLAPSHHHLTCKAEVKGQGSAGEEETQLTNTLVDTE